MYPGSQFFRQSSCLGRGSRLLLLFPVSPVASVSAMLPSAVRRSSVVAVPSPHQAWSRAVVPRLAARRVVDRWICQTWLAPPQHASQLIHERRSWIQFGISPDGSLTPVIYWHFSRLKPQDTDRLPSIQSASMLC